MASVSGHQIDKVGNSPASFLSKCLVKIVESNKNIFFWQIVIKNCGLFVEVFDVNDPFPKCAG